MTRKAPLPPELGGTASREEWVAAVKRADARYLYDEVQKATARASAVEPAERARLLRHAADELERHSAGNPVQRSQERVRERESWPNRQFFAPTATVKPSEEMRRRWIDEHRARHGKAPIEWGPLTLTKPEPRPVPSAAEQAAQLKARAEEVQPMRFYSERFRQDAAARKAMDRPRDEQERDR